ncbi:hypothetical protein ACLBOM_11985 [Escherichia coli]
MKKLRVAACMLMLALAGCDNNDNAPTAVKMRLLKLLKRPLQKTRVQQNSPCRRDKNWPQQSAGKVLTLLDLLKSNLMVQPRWC